MARYAALVLLVLALFAGNFAHAFNQQSEEAMNGNVAGVKEDIKAIFEQWMAKFEKTYEKVEDFEYRMKVFAENHVKILKHNLSEGKSFTMKMNQFGDLTSEEFAKMYNGLKVDMSKIGVLGAPATSDIDISDLPEEIDWRKKGAVTAVKNQGQCGSCWSFSTTGSLEGANFLATGKLISLSEQELVSCSSSEGNMACNGGLMDNAFKWIENDNHGIASEDDYPYKSGGGNVPSCQKSQHQNVADIESYTDVDEQDPKALMKAVAQQPVSIAIEADRHAFQFYSKGVIKEGTCGTALDHGVLAVGYGTEDGTDYWLVKNSWASSWGDEGYVKLERNMSKTGPGTCGIQLKASYPTATKKVPPSPPPAPPPGPACGVLKKKTCESGTNCCCTQRGTFFCKNWTCCSDDDDSCMSHCQ